MIKYPGTNNPHLFYQLRVARRIPGHFTIFVFSIILSVTVEGWEYARNIRQPALDWEEWTGMRLSSVLRSATQIYWMCFMQVFPLYHCSQFPVQGKLGQWPFVLGHLPIWACFGIYSPFVFVGKNPKVQHLWLTNMWLDVICTDVALKMHFPFLERPPMHRQAPPEKTTTFLDVDLFWHGASAILNRTHRGAKTILLGPLWNSLERSWTPWT